jgi:chaperonin GroEL
MIVKQLDFGEGAREKLARGKFVAIESEHHTGGLTTTKDGVTVANSINLYDPVEDLAVRMVRQAAQNTASAAGDGTTTSIVLAEAIINAVFSEELEDSNMTEVTRYIQKHSEQIIKDLDKRAKKLTGRRLYSVATISANNDKEMGKIIGDAYKYVGRDGVVTVANSRSTETYTDIIEGMGLDRGYTTKYYVTDKKKNECVLEKPYVLIYDQELPSLRHIESILKFVVSKGRPLLVIGEMALDASSTMAANVVKGNVKGCNIIPPSFGFRREQILQDICAATGATYISEKLGNDWDTIDPSVLGEVDKVVVTDSRTVLFNDKPTEATIDLVSDLNDKLNKETDLGKKEVLRERLSVLNGKAAVIYVGGNSDIEQKERKDRVDDAVFATRAAMEEGILPGGGIALLESRVKVLSDNRDEITAANALESSLEAPFKQIMENAGKDSDEMIDIIDDRGEKGYGYDVKAEKFGDVMKMGVIDPAKVTKLALRNAVSVATTILMSETVITNMRSDGGSGN